MWYIDSFILKYFKEFKINMSLEWPVDSNETKSSPEVGQERTV
jgi:hypothetical protein